MFGNKNLKDSQGLHYTIRHLKPSNITPLKDQLSKQLKNLREVNTHGTPVPPCIHRPGSRYLSSFLVGKN